uniref:Uncharacterized LOC107709979 n=1 Tax=Sinocyclocheilus rhinocerous TaxID=307959 RepID=A0A673N6W0_9TELE
GQATPPHIELLWVLTGCVGAQSIEQPKRLQATKLGDNVTIECYLPNKDFNNIVWYKQDMGMKLQIISKSYIYLTKVDFTDGYNDGRFNVTISKGIYHLHISLTKKEDIATYFCGVITLGELYFGPGTFLMLNGMLELSLCHTSIMVLQEPVSDKVHIGDNITLTCRVQTVDEKCEGGHHAYWFREAAEESSPGIIYTDGDMKKHGEICKDDSTKQSCVHTLKKRNLSLSDAGTYYCAVLVCGKIILLILIIYSMSGNHGPLEVLNNTTFSSIPMSIHRSGPKRGNTGKPKHVFCTLVIQMCQCIKHGELNSTRYNQML